MNVELDKLLYFFKENGEARDRETTVLYNNIKSYISIYNWFHIDYNTTFIYFYYNQ